MDAIVHRSYGIGSILPPRPYYGSSRPKAPTRGFLNSSRSSALGEALGALGGTLGCLLCLAAIGALGLFACVVALTVYTKQFLDEYKDQAQLNGTIKQLQICVLLLFTSLWYVAVSYHRSN